MIQQQENFRPSYQPWPMVTKTAEEGLRLARPWEAYTAFRTLFFVDDLI